MPSEMERQNRKLMNQEDRWGATFETLSEKLQRLWYGGAPRVLAIYETDFPHSPVRLTPTEALELLALLKRNETVLREMAGAEAKQ